MQTARTLEFLVLCLDVQIVEVAAWRFRFRSGKEVKQGFATSVKSIPTDIK